jgi:hypothetical protein
MALSRPDRYHGIAASNYSAAVFAAITKSRSGLRSVDIASGKT